MATTQRPQSQRAEKNAVIFWLSYPTPENFGIIAQKSISMSPSRDGAETISSATLIITASNDFTRPIHERMPVFLGQEDHDTCLTGKAGVEMLRSAPNDLLRMWPVSIRVNKSGQGDDDPGLIDAIEDEAIDRRS
jgi:putative SOS response-associated peptidase YedK